MFCLKANKMVCASLSRMAEMYSLIKSASGTRSVCVCGGDDKQAERTREREIWPTRHHDLDFGRLDGSTVQTELL